MEVAVMMSMSSDVPRVAGISGMRKLLARLRVPVLYAMLLLGITAFVLIDQADSGGFFPGHHGWVSSHALAIATHVTAANGWIGYAVQSVAPGGGVEYHYFDRYPLWISLLFSAVLASADSFAEQIVAGRQVMNLFFLGMLVGLMSLIYRLVRSHAVAIGSTLIAMSSYYVVQYRDMIHYDQPALFGLVLALHVILNVEEGGRLGRNLLLLLLAVSLGRGYALLPLLLLWSGVVLWRATRNGNVMSGFSDWLHSPSFKALVLVVAACAAYITYNVATEARVRDVPVVETSIVESAVRRLGISEDFATHRADPFTWSRHLSLQLERYAISLVPYPPVGSAELKAAVPYYVGRLGWIAHALILGIAAVIVVAAARSLRPAGRVVFLMLASSGLLWLAPMKNLAIAHVYTTMFQLGAVAAFYCAVLVMFRSLPKVQKLAAVGAALIFLGSLHAANTSRLKDIDRINSVSREFGRIIQIVPENVGVYVAPPYDVTVDSAPDIVPGAPYAVAFYLGNRLISLNDDEEFSLSRHRQWTSDRHCSILLTPENKHVFLFRKHACN